MACYHPISGFQRQDGKFTLDSRFGVRTLVIPCGNCVGCRLRRSGEWAVRGTHEASLYLFNSFITLTYDDKRLPFRQEGQIPANVGLCYDDFQDFMKRLRKRFGTDIRYMVCGEYGDQLGRPHFHAILFNFRFADVRKWYVTKQKHQVFRSAILEELWPWGNSDIGSVTPQSIAYVSRYVMKKVNGKNQNDHYFWSDPSTGEIFIRRPEFAKYSLKPGIGARWFEQFHSSVYPHDYVIFNGKRVRPPRYYDKLYQRMTGVAFSRDITLSTGDVIETVIESFSAAFDDIRAQREQTANLFLDDNTPERLAVREQVAQAKVGSLKRKLT